MLSEEVSLLNTPQFMKMMNLKTGQKMNEAQQVEYIRGFIKRQKRIKGFSFTAPVGSETFTIELSGSARIFLGMAFFGKPVLAGTAAWTNFFDITQVQFTINNEIIIDQLDPNFLTQQFNNQEYYYLPRPLNGQDTITLATQNAGIITEQINIVIYYI